MKLNWILLSLFLVLQRRKKQLQVMNTAPQPSSNPDILENTLFGVAKTAKHEGTFYEEPPVALEGGTQETKRPQLTSLPHR